MANTTIRNIVKTAANQPIQGVNVVVDLAIINSDASLSFPQGFINLGNASTDYSVNYSTTATTDVSGVWSMQVPGNAAYANISNSVYRVTETYGGILRTYYISVPNDGGTYWVGSILSNTPGIIGSNIAINDLSDVDTTGIQINDYLVWNGTNFVPHSPSATRSVITSLGGANVSTAVDGYTGAANDINNRYLMSFPVKPTRFRLRIKNYNTLTGTSGTGTANVTAWYATPAVNTSSPFRWIGGFSSTATQIPINGGSTPALLSGSTELVTDWVTATSINEGTDVCFSIGYTGTVSGSFVPAGVDSVGGLARIATSAGLDTNAQATTFTATTCEMFTDVRIEYEFKSDLDANGRYKTKKILFIGDSITAGHLQSNFASSGPYNFRTDTFPELAGLKNKFAVINAGVGQSRWEDNSPSYYGWSAVTSTAHRFLSRVNFGSDIPDACVIALGTNDCGGTASLSTIQDAMAAVIQNVRSMGINTIYLATIIPGGYGLPITVSTTTVQNSTTATVSSTSLLSPGMPVSGTGIQSGTKVVAVIGTNKVELSLSASQSGTNSILYGSSAPHWSTDQREIIRQQLNDFIRTLPFNVQGVFDISKSVEFPGINSVADASYLPYYPHPTMRGFQKIAERIQIS